GGARGRPCAAARGVAVRRSAGFGGLPGRLVAGPWGQRASGGRRRRPGGTRPGEEKGRYTNTEARLYRVKGHSRLVRVSPGLEGYVKQVVPLADGSLLVTPAVSTRMRVSTVEPR